MLVGVLNKTHNIKIITRLGMRFQDYLRTLLVLFYLPLVVLFHHKRSDRGQYAKGQNLPSKAMRWEEIICIFFISFFYLERTCLIFTLFSVLDSPIAVYSV